MKVIRPTTIHPEMLLASNIPENDAPAWDAGKDYLVGEQVIDAMMVYESVQTPNEGHIPNESPLHWARVAVTNRWAMFDSEISTVTVGDPTIEVELAPGIVNSLALMEIRGKELSVEVRDGEGGSLVYEYSRELEQSVVGDWYQYFFQPYEQATQVALTNIPQMLSARMKITLTGGPASISTVLVGSVNKLGDAEHGVQIGIIDFSRKETTPEGVTSLNKRKFSRRMSAQLMLDNSQLNRVARTLSDLRATACVWIGTDASGYDPLTVYGFYQDFTIDIAYPTKSYCSLEIEGLT